MDINDFLKRNNYIKATETETYIFDIWLEEHPDYIIHYVINPKSEIFTISKSDEKVYHIIWDVSFWELFIKFIYIIDEHNFSIVSDTDVLLENTGYILALFFSYLSMRYNYNQEVSKVLKQNANDFGYQILIDNFYGNKDEKQSYEFPTFLCKQFVFWHEVAHIEFHKFETQNFLQQHIELVYSLLDEVPDSIFNDEMLYSKEIKQKIKTRTIPQDLIEELAADLRAMQRMLNFDYFSKVKNNKFIMISSILSLIDFIILKTIIDQRWDCYLLKKMKKLSILVENQIIRKMLLPYLVFIELGDSFLYDIQEQQNNTDLFLNNIYIIMDEWYIKSLLKKQCYEINIEIIEKFYMLNNIYIHMNAISVDISSKRLKHLFNIAYTKKYGDNPLESIPLFYKYIDMALKKGDENKRYIGDAYSHIAQLYMKNGELIKAEILLNNAIGIAENLRKDNINVAFLFNNIGNSFLLLKNVNMAIKYYLKSLNLRIKFNDLYSIDVIAIYENLGICFFTQQKFPQALKYYFKAYKIIKMRYNKDNIRLIRIKKELKLFMKVSYNIKTVKFLDKSFLDEEHLCEMIQDLLIMSFDEGYNHYIKIIELIEENVNNFDSDIFSWFAFVNMLNLLKTEIEKHKF